MADIDVLDRDTNQVVKVDAADATAGFRDGRYALPPTNAQVWMTSPDGQVVNAYADKAAEAIQGGMRFATQDEQRQGRAEDDVVQSGLEGLQRAVSGGLSDLYAKEQLAADPEAFKDFQARSQTSASTVGQTIGFGAGLLGADVASLGARALAKSVGNTAAAQAARVATTDAAHAVLTKIAKDRVSRAAIDAAVGSAARAGTEGFLYGVGGNLSEQALSEDPDLSVEQLLASGLMGSFIGAGVDSALGAVPILRGAKKAGASRAEFGQGVTNIPEDVLRVAREAGGVTNMSDKQLAAAVSRLTGEELTEKGTSLLGKMWRGVEENLIDPVAAAGSGISTEALRDLRSTKNLKVIREGQKGVEKVGDDLRSALDEMVAMGEADSKLAFQQLRPHLRAQVLDEMGTPEAVGAMGNAVASLRNQMDDFARSAPGMTTERAEAVLKPYRQELDRIERDMFKAAKVTRREDVQFHLSELAERADVDHAAAVKAGYDRLERLKNFMAKPAKFEQELGAAADKEIQRRFQDMYGGLRGHLEDSSIYGTAGAMQKELNEAAHSRIQAMEQLRQVFRIQPGQGVDPGAVMSHLSALKNMRGDKGVAALDAFVAAQNRFAQVVDKNFEGMAMAAPTKALSDRMADIRGELGNRVRVYNLVKEMVNSENQMLGGGMMFGGALAGGVYGGLPGAAVGAVAGGMLRPGRQLMMRAHMGAAMDGFKQLLKSRVGRTIEDLTPTTSIPKPSAEFMRRGLSRATIKMLEGSPKERREAYQERLSQLDRLENPDEAMAIAAPATRAYAQHAPTHITLASLKAAEGARVLKSHLPGLAPGRGNHDPLEPRTAVLTPTPPDRDIERFARLDAAITNPMRIVEDPNVTPEEVAAVGQVHPKFLEQVRALYGNLLAERTKPLSKGQRRRVATVMGQPAYQADKVVKWQALYKMPVTQGGAGSTGSTPRTSKNPKSASLAPLSDSTSKR